MKKKTILLITHVQFRDGMGVLGPYSTVVDTLEPKYGEIYKVELPLNGYEGPIRYGLNSSKRMLNLPKGLGAIAPVKYILDLLISFILLSIFLVKNSGNDVLIVAVDPLSTLPAIPLKTVFKNKLVFYSVDFNESRFSNFLQTAYEKADEWAGKYSDQTWAVCESLISYKKENHDVDALYVPNSFPFESEYYEDSKNSKKGNKVVWTGSILTDKQVGDIVRISRKLQEIRPELEFWYIPSNKAADFEVEIERQGLNNARVHRVKGQVESRKLVAECDVGLAVYDDEFGSTKYIEPIKIWEYMMYGLPFIISCEPSINSDIKKAGAVLLLEPKNGLPEDKKIEQFIDEDNIKNLREKCVELAEKYDTKTTMGNALSKLDF